MQKINVLQAGRALAALAVVTHHAAGSAGAFTSSLPAGLAAVLRMGYLGVDFFFVLSGFIVYHTAAGMTAATGVRKYALQRSIRIFVPYWPIGLGMAAVYVLVPAVGTGDRVWSWLESATLLPLGGGTALAVAWTLKHEVMFYLIFGVGLLFGRPLAVVCAWMGMVIFSMGFGYRPEHWASDWHSTLLSPINLEFAMGIAAALWYRSGRPIASTVALVCMVLPVALWLWLDRPRDMSFLVGFGLAVLIAWATARERDRGMAVPQALVFFGSASYAIYLIHLPILSLTARLAGTWPQALIGGVIIAVLGGVVYHLIVERPLLRIANNMVQPWRISRRARA